MCEDLSGPVSGPVSGPPGPAKRFVDCFAECESDSERRITVRDGERVRTGLDWESGISLGTGLAGKQGFIGTCTDTDST